MAVSTDTGVVTFVDAFTRALRDLGVRHAFGISGGAISFFWSALGGAGIDVTHFRHESGAAFAACEASMVTGEPVVVFVTAGPGLTNVLTGIYAARHETSRVILVSATTDRAMHGRRPIQETSPNTVPQQGIFTQGQLFDFAAVVDSADRLSDVVSALADGVVAPQGFCAHVSLTLAAQLQPVTLSHRPVSVPVLEAEHGRAAEIHAVLRDQPWVIWAGAGARPHAATVRRLARAAGVPVMVTPRGKGIVPEDAPSYLGVTGFAGHQSVLDYLERHRPEHVLVLGSAMGDAASGYHDGYVPRSAFVHVDLDPSVFGMTYPATTTIPVRGDLGEFTAELATLFEAEPRQAPHLDVHPFDDDVPATGDAVDPAELMAAVQSVFVERGLLVMAETGNALAWAINRLRFDDAAHWRAPSGLVGSMGHFSCGVVGAALVSGRTTVALVGDGSMLMLNEVSTAVHRGAPAIWVVLNDSLYNMCAQGARVLGLAEVDCAIPPTDFAGIARALGATGISVGRAGELTAALTHALHTDGPVVVDVRIDPDRGAPTKGRNAGLLRDSATRPGSP